MSSIFKHEFTLCFYMLLYLPTYFSVLTSSTYFSVPTSLSYFFSSSIVLHSSLQVFVILYSFIQIFIVLFVAFTCYFTCQCTFLSPLLSYSYFNIFLQFFYCSIQFFIGLFNSLQFYIHRSLQYFLQLQDVTLLANVLFCPHFSFSYFSIFLWFFNLYRSLLFFLVRF